MGYVTSYPASLRQLDLSHNEITCWPSLPRLSSSDPHLLCYNIDGSRSKVCGNWKYFDSKNQFYCFSNNFKPQLIKFDT